MLSMNDIINASFRKCSFSGYRTDDVDQFIDEVKESFDALMKRDIDQKEDYEKLKSENDQLREKIKILADKVEEYRLEEDEIKNALVSAQKLGDASIRESRHKAEIIIKDANLKAERVVSGARQSVVDQQNELERLQQTVSDFRSKLLNIYKEHLTLINALPTHKPATKMSAPPTPPAQTVSEPEPEQADDLQQPAEETPAPNPEAFFRAEVSNFDDDTPTQEETAPRYSSIQISDEYDISDDMDSPDGILNQNK